MSPETLNKLAQDVADATGIQVAEAKDALRSDDPSIIAVAQGLVELRESRDEWRAEMKRHRRNILATA